MHRLIGLASAIGMALGMPLASTGATAGGWDDCECGDYSYDTPPAYYAPPPAFAYAPPVYYPPPVYYAAPPVYGYFAPPAAYAYYPDRYTYGYRARHFEGYRVHWR